MGASLPFGRKTLSEGTGWRGLLPSPDPISVTRWFNEKRKAATPAVK